MCNRLFYEDERANIGSPGPKLARFVLFVFKPLKNLGPQMARTSGEKNTFAAFAPLSSPFLAVKHAQAVDKKEQRKRRFQVGTTFALRR